MDGITKPEERSALETIEHELYDPKVHINDAEIHEVKERKKVDLPTSWEESGPIITKGKDEQGMSFGAKLLLLSTIFLALVLSFSAWRVFSLRNVVSSANIDMSADLTPYAEGGESVPLTVTLRNRNIATLENAKLTLLYKQGNGSQDEQEKVQEKRDLGNIAKDEYKKQDFSLVLYGKEAESRDITLKLEYEVPGSNALFNKVVVSKVILRTPPVSVHIDGPDKLSVGQVGTYTFTIKNNSATTSLPSLLLLTLPTNFSIESTNPKSVTRNNTWNIAPLKKGETTTITVTGLFTGKQGEIGTLEAKIGSIGDSPTQMGVVYSSESTDVTLRSSPLTLQVDLISDMGGADAIRYNDRAMVTVSYTNTSAQALQDVSLVVTLSGDAPLYSSINPTTGYYDSQRKTITWDKASVPDLAVLAPNAQGTFQIIIPIIQKGTNSSSLKITTTGTASTKTQGDVVATLSKSWGVQGSATLIAKTQYKNSPFKNSGPIPPKPNEETTYTASLKVSAQNTLSKASVSFVLPTYVSWENVFTQDKIITYDSKTRTVYWDIGRLEQGAVAEANIMLRVKPSQSHVNQTPVITSGIILEADEDISRAHLKTTLSPLTTSVYNEMWPKNPSVVVEE
jgi:hypothetical protein